MNGDTCYQALLVKSKSHLIRRSGSQRINGLTFTVNFMELGSFLISKVYSSTS